MWLLVALVSGRQLTSQATRVVAAHGEKKNVATATFENVIVVGVVGVRDDAAYVFDATTHAQLAKLDDDKKTSLFGCSVALDASVIVVGAMYDDQVGVDAGAAHVFDLESLVRLAKLTPSAPGVYFGCSVAIFDNKIVVGAYRGGSVYVFDGTSFDPLCELSGEHPRDAFGRSVAIHRTTIVVGAPKNENAAGAAYVFDAATCARKKKLAASDAAESDGLGEAVAVYDATIVAGARFCDVDGYSDAGAVYVFGGGGPTYAQLAKLKASDGAAANDWFGRSVAIFDDKIAVGAGGDHDSGATYVFEHNQGTHVQIIAKLPGSDEGVFSRTVALYDNALVVVAGSEGAGDVAELDQGNIQVDDGMQEDDGQIFYFPSTTKSSPAPVTPLPVTPTPFIFDDEGGYYDDAVGCPQTNSTNSTCNGTLMDFIMYDDWGDGWNGACFAINNSACPSCEVEQGTLYSGYQGTQEVCIHCDAPDIVATRELAENEPLRRRLW
ncbi:hypothetical protein CTAYLR_004881 [Chrysophaeum taylorii]|uniref:Uncharacterized protein n=1 Tax=Chrysophaeum taylorii TaxID=2483200 RepID=A0AAD7UEW9_9STRA|nr:hypothetical protein CTAYLR_004881 [Chrysophaeum taylorii]